MSRYIIVLGKEHKYEQNNHAKNKKSYIQSLKDAFHAGCTHGEFINHDAGVYEQAELGAQAYVNEITEEEMYKRIEEIVKNE